MIDLGTVETFPVFQAAQHGLIDQDTCRVLIEAQLTMGGLLQPDSPLSLSLEQGLAQGLIDTHTSQSLSELESALRLVDDAKPIEGQQKLLLPVAAAMEEGLIREEVGLRILELQMNTGCLRDSRGERLSLEMAGETGLLTPRTFTKLQSRLQRRELIDPNTAEKLNLSELQQRCVLSDDSGLRLLPVKQQPGGTVCLRSGRKVGIFRAVQEGLIDRQITVRLLEAQLFAGGIADPRSGHRLTIDEAVRHGLIDQELACAMLARQLQSGGILDPFNGERLEIEEAIRRDLLSSRLALLVLESIWAFMGMLWPESGELLPIAEALQQGVISGELARNILRQRHAVGALYNPETPQVLHLNQAAEEALTPSVVEVLREIHIPDVLPNMNRSSTPSLNRLSWGSTSSTPPPSSPPPGSPPTGLVWDPTPMDGMDPKEQANYRLLFHLMTHSYVDAHSGKRLVLLEPELVELVKATGLVAEDSLSGDRDQAGCSLASSTQVAMEVMADEGERVELMEIDEEGSKVITPGKDISSSKMIEKFHSEGKGDDRGHDRIQQHKTTVIKDSESAFRAKDEIDGRVKKKMRETFNMESFKASAREHEVESTKDYDENKATAIESKPSERHRQESESPLKHADMIQTVSRGTSSATTLAVDKETNLTPLKTKEVILTSTQEKEPAVSPLVKTEKAIVSTSAKDDKAMKHTPTVSESVKPQITITETASVKAKQITKPQSVEVKSEEDAELDRLAMELKQGGLVTEEGERLLPDEAVAQGILPGHTAVKLMAQAGLFGGFLDVSTCESLSLEDVMQEGLLDEDLMWSVLKSDKTLAGVVDVEKGQIRGLREAAQAGLIDPNTAARLLEAQVVSGGIVDLRRDKKVSVTLAANLGLIEEDQREQLVALEKAYRGKTTDPDTALTKATLQLQMEGVVDPQTKCPVLLEQAIQKGLVRPEEAYQALSKQVAEGGILHHASGARLSVSNAIERGLVDRSIATGLEQLEWVYQGKVDSSSHPEAAIFQASTGAIWDPESRHRLTLTEAVSQGLLDESIAKEAMASPSASQGVLDPQTACIVPYSDLVNQGKIDIETGKRFLEVKPFRGVQDKQTGDSLTLPQAIASNKVDPVPALRLLQSQADSGGIIDITSGDRLPLPEASKRGLVGEDMVRIIATKQVMKGGLVDPTTGQRVSSLKDAIIAGLISSDMAPEIQENLTSMDIEGEDEDSWTLVASSNGSYSPVITLSVSSQDSQAKKSAESTELDLPSPLSEKEQEKGLIVSEDVEKPLTSGTTKRATFYEPNMEEELVDELVPVGEKTVSEPDQSIDLLTRFASKAEKRLQQAIQEIEPQKDVAYQTEPLPKQWSAEKLHKTKSEAVEKGEEREDSDHAPSKVDSIQAQVSHAIVKDSQSEARKETAVTQLVGQHTHISKKKSKPVVESVSAVKHAVVDDGTLTDSTPARVREERENKDNIEVSTLTASDEKYGKNSDGRGESVEEKGKRVNDEKEVKPEARDGTDIAHSDQAPTSPSKETESKSKKKRKNKKKGKGKEADSEAQPAERTSENDKADMESDSQAKVSESVGDAVTSQGKDQKSQPQDSQSAPKELLNGKGVKAKIDGRIDAQDVLVKQGQEAAQVSPEKGQKIYKLKNGKEGDEEEEEKKRDEHKEEVTQLVKHKEEGDSVHQQAEQHEAKQLKKYRKEGELPLKSNLPDREKEALILKAKESILRKVFERGVSEKQAAEELEALRKEVGKKESQGTTVREVKGEALSAKVDSGDSHSAKDGRVKRAPDGKPKEGKEGIRGKEEKGRINIKKGISVEGPSVKEVVGVDRLSEALSRENEGKAVSEKKEGDKEDKSPPDQLKDAKQGKRKKSKKSKILKATDKVEPVTEEKPSVADEAKSEVMTAKMTTTTTQEIMTKTDLDSSVSSCDQKTDRQSDGQADSDATRPSSSDERNKKATSTVCPKGADASQQRLSYSSPSEEPKTQTGERIQVEVVKSGEKQLELDKHFGVSTPSEPFHPETRHAVDFIESSREALTSLPDIQPTEPCAVTEPSQTTGKGKKKKKQQQLPVQQQLQQQHVESTADPESKPLQDEQQHRQSPKSDPSLTEDIQTESESTEVPESDTTTESWGEEEEDGEIGETKREKSTAKTGKVS